MYEAPHRTGELPGDAAIYNFGDSARAAKQLRAFAPAINGDVFCAV
jgi:hypothetical protein